MLTGWKEKDDRTRREMCKYMEREELDAFIPSKIPHVAYLLNYYDSLHAHILWEEMAGVLVVPRNGDAFLVGSHSHLAGDPEAGVAPWWLKERYAGGRPGITAWEKTTALLTEMGLHEGRIGIEKKALPVALYDYLREALPHAELLSADLLVPQIRFIKTEREIALMRSAAELAVRSMEAYMAAIRAGASVAEAQCVRAQRALALGGEWPGGPYRLSWTGGTDETPAWWDNEARQRFKATSRSWKRSPDNAPCFVTHFQGVFQNYFADLAWHEFYGPEPAPDDIILAGDRHVPYSAALRDFQILRRVQTEALSQIKPGMDHVTAKQAVDAFLATDPEARAHVTNYYIHGIGLEIHEEPVLTGYVPEPTPLDGPIRFGPGALVSSEWFTRAWTVEEPFVMTETGWEPLVELRGLTPGARRDSTPRNPRSM
ncbi:MAG: aminopeptidase P family protein [Victivallales bacterium]|nr:aminopeptidase P family protein [Victivallales bacterium]MBT7304437.1 aminopeptidase P family protein [Victivallales bacterium]